MFEVITGTAIIPISVETRFSEYFPKIEENNAGKISEMVARSVKHIVTMPIKIEIFGID